MIKWKLSKNMYLVVIIATFFLMVATVVLLYIVYIKQENILTGGLNKVSNNEKKALIMHGWGAAPGMHWFQEEKEILEGMDYDVSLPLMPKKYNPKENEWLNVVNEFRPGENTVLIGHSLGGTTILEYLENSDTKVDTVVLVSTPVEYTEKLEEDGFKGFKLYVRNLATDAFLKTCEYEEIYDWEKIKNSANRFILIYKEEDLRVPTIQGEFVAHKLGGQLNIIEGNDHGHIFDLGLINRQLENE